MENRGVTAYTETYKPNIICITETWLDEVKENARRIDGYQTHYGHCLGMVR